MLDDADLSVAAEAAVKSRFGNVGQSCIAAKRFIVAESVLTISWRCWPPVSPRSSSARWRAATCATSLHAQVLASVSEGASLVAGGVLQEGPGWFYPPTVLDHVTPRMTAFDEETFGPVAAVVRARDDDHAVALANDTAYGLGAAVWSSSPRGLAVGKRIRSGALFVNARVASDPRLPFGGIGRSGYGRELSAEGTREFTNVRTVYVG